MYPSGEGLPPGQQESPPDQSIFGPPQGPPDMSTEVVGGATPTVTYGGPPQPRYDAQPPYVAPSTVAYGAPPPLPSDAQPQPYEVPRTVSYGAEPQPYDAPSTVAYGAQPQPHDAPLTVTYGAQPQPHDAPLTVSYGSQPHDAPPTVMYGASPQLHDAQPQPNDAQAQTANTVRAQTGYGIQQPPFAIAPQPTYGMAGAMPNVTPDSPNGPAGQWHTGSPPPPPPTTKRSKLVIGLAVGIPAALVVAGIAAVAWFGHTYHDPVQAPKLEAIGMCSHLDGMGIGVDKPLTPMNCSDPAATGKVVTSQAQVVNQKLECPEGQFYVWETGSAATDYTGVESCLEPNLIAGKCYSVLEAGNFTYHPNCRNGSVTGRLDRIAPGVADTGVCKDSPAPKDPAHPSVGMSMTTLNFVDQQRNATYCFVSVS